MADTNKLYCDNCGSIGFDNGADGFFYCRCCGSQSQDVVDMVIEADEAMANTLYSRTLFREKSQAQPSVKTEPLSQTQSQTPFSNSLNPDTKEKPYSFEDEISVPNDFGDRKNSHPDAETLATGVRLRYVKGIQIMLQMQCEALVEKFGVNAMICGLAGSIWLRFVGATRVFEPGWASDVIVDSEVVLQERVGEEEEQKLHKTSTNRYRGEPHNLYGERAVTIWFKYLKRSIPLASSLAVSFLACHVARETVLPTDIAKWVIEGKLPYLAVFADIEKYIGTPSSACPLSSRALFRPLRAVGTWQLESLAGSIAEKIGLHVPPVNFYGIAHRYLKELSLQIEKILPYACRIFEWSMPPDLWLATNLYRLPTRVCVMSIIIVAMRILYNIHGFGVWEMSLTGIGSLLPSCKSAVGLTCGSEESNAPYAFEKKVSGVNDCEMNDKSYTIKLETTPTRTSSHIQSSEMDTAQLLCHLEKAYENLSDIPDYLRDLPSYLKHCKDVIFAGATTSYEEENIIEQLWNIYENQEDVKPAPAVDSEKTCGDFNQKSSRDERHVDIDEKMSKAEVQGINHKTVNNATIQSKHKRKFSMSVDHEKGVTDTDNGARCSSKSECPSSSNMPPPGNPLTTQKESALRKLKSNMEEHMFTYLPPRPASKKQGYLLYRRKKIGGVLTYVAHADYYILLRACARLVQVDARLMHLGVLKLERRVSWIENRIDDTLLSMSELSLMPNASDPNEIEETLDLSNS